MHQFNIDLEAAMAWVASYHKGVENKFLDGMRKLPSFGPAVDRELQEYVLALAIFPRANDCWSFESGRYFGTKGLQVQKTRYVPLLPKVRTDPTLKQRQVVVSVVDCLKHSIWPGRRGGMPTPDANVTIQPTLC